MRLLLDTHIYLWCLSGSRKLSQKARRQIAEAEDVYVSAASIWEAAIKTGLGKLRVDVAAMAAAIEPSGFLELPVMARHAAMVAALPGHHRDPFDRLLIAQALDGPLRLLTSDRVLEQYSPLVSLV